MGTAVDERRNGPTNDDARTQSCLVFCSSLVVEGGTTDGPGRDAYPAKPRPAH